MSLALALMVNSLVLRVKSLVLALALSFESLTLALDYVSDLDSQCYVCSSWLWCL